MTAKAPLASCSACSAAPFVSSSSKKRPVELHDFIPDMRLTERQIGTVKSLFLKRAKGKPMSPVDVLGFEARTGRMFRPEDEQDEDPDREARQPESKRRKVAAGAVRAAAPGACSSSRSEGPPSEAALQREELQHRPPDSMYNAASGLLRRVVGKVFGAAGAAPGAAKNASDGHGDPLLLQPLTSLSPRQVLFSSTPDLEKFAFAAGDLRENICIEMLGDVGQKVATPTPSSSASVFHAIARSGFLLRAGNSCCFRLSFHCEPCGFVLDLLPEARKKREQPPLPTVGQLNGHRGVLATCVSGGTVRAGDAVFLMGRLEKNKDKEVPHLDQVHEALARTTLGGPVFEPLPNDVRGRVLGLLLSADRVPAGRVVTIKDLLHYIGAPTGYARALPAMLKKAFTDTSTANADGNSKTENSGKRSTAITKENRHAGLYRLVDSNGLTLERHLPGQGEQLRKEGVDVAGDGKVRNLQSVKWTPTHDELFLRPASGPGRLSNGK